MIVVYLGKSEYLDWKQGKGPHRHDIGRAISIAEEVYVGHGKVCVKSRDGRNEDVEPDAEDSDTA